jgi:hypothetical protein
LNKLILAVTITAAVALPSIVVAQGTAPRAALRLPPPGTVVCRPARSNETANATMGTVQLRCRNVNTTRIRTAMNALHASMSSMPPSQQTQMQSSINSYFEELQPPIPGGLGENDQ